MAFSRYPTSGNPPLALAGGGASAFVPFTPHIGVAGGFNHMYIHLALSAAAANPEVRLWANGGVPPAVGGGVVVPYSATDTYATLNDSTGVAIGVFFMKPLLTLADGVTPVTTVYRIDMLLFGTGNTNWHLRITNTDANPKEFTWVVADSVTEAEQPWLNITTLTLTYRVLVNQPVVSASQTLQVKNMGTGLMTINGLEAGSSVAPNFSLGALPPPIAPGDTASIVVDVTGAQAAPLQQLINANLTLAAAKPDNDATTIAGHSKRFTIDAAFITLQVALLFDTSASMDDMDGGTETRWSKLLSAANSFLDQLCSFGGGSGIIGIARFPHDGTGQHNINAPVPIPNDATALKLGLATVNTRNSTPMGEGLQHVANSVNGFFPNDGIAANLKSRWVIMFSDGAHNSGIAPEPTANTLRSSDIRVYTLRYGVPGNWEVDHARLQTIAYAASYSVAAIGTPNALASAFSTVLKSGITPVEAAADPGGTLTAGNSEVRRQVLITSYDQKAIFSLYWNTANAGRMRLQLLSPTCDLITPDEFDPNHITFIGDNRYQSFIIDRAFLENSDDPTRPRFGTWTLIISSDQLAGGDSEQFIYDVLLDSRLQLNLGFDRTVYYAGDAIGITARLTLDGAPVRGAAVKVDITSPAFSFNNQLATIDVTDAQIQEAAHSITSQDSSFWQIKSTAVKLFKLGPLTHGQQTRVITLSESSPGVYTGSFAETSVPENYEYYVTASGITSDDIQFRREKSRQIYLQVRPAPDFSLVWLDYLDLVADTDRPYRARINVLPRDRFGNVLLVNPDDPASLSLSVKGARETGALTANLDGSYSMAAVFDSGTPPLVTLRTQGFSITPPQASASLGRLTFAAKVVAFTPGRDGTNQFADPQNALGSPFQKSDDAFVSLGAYGSITLTNDKEMIVSRGQSDIFVFVQPDQDLRGYKVEALDPRKKVWLLLGTSQGISQGFSLSAAKLRYSQMIRITDMSGRARDRTLQPLASPGVSVRGVGFVPVDKETLAIALSEDNNGCLPVLLRSLVRLMSERR